jgi:flagellar hook-associated protein 3 FlgL
MISLSTSAFYEQSARQIGSLRAEADDLQRQIGTGERLSRSSDDPVAAARLRTLNRSQRLAEIDQRNSDLAQTDLKLTDNALASIANVIIRAKVLATQAANGSVNAEQRAAIGEEIAGLKQSLVVFANTRNGAGHALFGGQAAGAAYADSGAGATYLGTASADAVDLGDGQTVTPSMTGPEVFEFDAGGSPTDLFAVLGNLAAALQGGGGDQIAASHDAMNGLDAALGKVTTAQTVVGARMGWIETMDQRREATGELISDEQSSVGGADLATTMTRLQEITTVLQASQASFVRLSNLTLFDMLR